MESIVVHDNLPESNNEHARMVQRQCNNRTKYCLLTLHVLFLVGAVTLLYFGVRVVFHQQHELTIKEDARFDGIPASFYGAPYIVIATGCLVCVVAVVGIAGTQQENIFLLLIFLSSMIAIGFIALVLGIWGFVESQSLGSRVHGAMEKLVATYYNDTLSQAVMTAIQGYFVCCGMYTVSDYVYRDEGVPWPCPNATIPSINGTTVTKQPGNDGNPPGCFALVLILLAKTVFILCSVLVVLFMYAVIEIFLTAYFFIEIRRASLAGAN